MEGGGGSHNILALSDVHLGWDLKDAPEERAQALDHDLSAFLAHYAAQRAGGRAWKLIFAGDLVDFISVTLVPREGMELTEEERRWGLHTGEDRAAWKLAQVFARHALVVKKLAEFVASGNALAVVRGNHDLEFYWPRVQSAFKEMLADAVGLAGRERERFLARIEFHPWFYLEPGRLFLEHGHVHDEYSTFDYVLEPVAPDDPGRLDLPMSSLAMRYFANKYAGKIDPGDVDAWELWDYLRWVAQVGNPLRVFADYLAMVWRILYPIAVKGGLWSRRAVGAGERIVGERVEQVKSLLSRFVGGGEEVARHALALLALMRPPASRRLLNALQLFFMDRILLALGAAAGAGAVSAAPLPGWLRVAVVGMIALAAVRLNRWLSRRRQAETGPKLLEAAARLGRLFGVRYVVMGHSHRPVAAAEVAPGTRYFNLGTWSHSPGGARPRHGLTHLVIEGDKAELRRWDG